MDPAESVASGTTVWTWGPAPVGEPGYWGIWSPDGRLLGTTNQHGRALRLVCRLNRDHLMSVLRWLGEQIALAEAAVPRCTCEAGATTASVSPGRPGMATRQPGRLRMQPTEATIGQRVQVTNNADEFILGESLAMPRPPRQETAVLAVYLTVADCQKLDQIARATGKTLTEVVQDAIRAYSPAVVGQEKVKR